MTDSATQPRTSGENPEIGAFHYSEPSAKSGMKPLNLAGLSFGGNGKAFSDRLWEGMRFLVKVKPESDSGPSGASSPSEGMGVFRYHLPLQDYRARRRRAAVIGRRIAVAGALIVALPIGYHLAHRTTPLGSKFPLATAALHLTAPAVKVAAPAASASVSMPALSYTVKEGDTLGEVAQRLHVKRRALLAANDLKPTHKLRIGEVLKVPALAVAVAPVPGALTDAAALAAHEATGVAPQGNAAAPQANAAVSPATPAPSAVTASSVKDASKAPLSEAGAKKVDAPKPRKRYERIRYVVQSGDTLSEIATRFGVHTGAIVEINDLDFHTALRIGRKIVIPPNVEDSSPKKSGDSERNYRGRDKRKHASRGLLGDIGRMIVKHFLWPTAGRVSSGFGERSDHFHTGLDIPNHVGASIRASKPGVVVSAGWSGDYGRAVDISHGNGVVTRYAHCSKLLVHAGEHISQGEVIALVGETGRATGPHLHFEVRVNGRPVNPEKFF